MEAKHLRTLHQKNPVGIDKLPYFSWQIESDVPNTVQIAYNITVRNDVSVVWESGVQKSNCQSFVVYEGPALASRTIYCWTVTVWDNYGNESCKSAYFETAFLCKSDWNAVWVESSLPHEIPEKLDYSSQAPAVLFHRMFHLNVNIKTARLYATAYGVYHVRLNGKRPDDREFAPEFTVYRSILYYQTYDVTALLHSGENKFEMEVADGWYMCRQTQPTCGEYHGIPSILYQLEVEYADGRHAIIASDGSEVCTTGLVRFSNIFQGEMQDFSLTAQPAQPVKTESYGFGNLRAQPMPPVRPLKLLPATNVLTTPKGEIIVDFGQLLCGRARIRLDLPKGAEATFEYFEALDKDGNYCNTMYCLQKDMVVSGGEPILYEARYTFHGFRYIRVSGISKVNKEDFTAVLLTTEKENIGSFSCSDERLNRLYQNIRWSQANNMMSVPTDCPSRERAGWTGDILIYADAALRNEELTPFLTSWLANMTADQLENGVITMTTPYTMTYKTLAMNMANDFGNTCTTGIAGWSDAAVWVPYSMYRATGNTRILSAQYPTMKRWCEYILRTASGKRGNLNLPEEIDSWLWDTDFHFGEWLIPSEINKPKSSNFDHCKNSACYIAPFFGYATLAKMSKISETLGHADDAQHYKKCAEKMKWAIQEGLLKHKHLSEQFMGFYVLAFAFSLVPAEMCDEYDQNLVHLIEKHGNCLDTGFLATPFLLDVLVKLGHRELACKILWQCKQPSWLYEVEHGATAIWEDWNAMDTDGQPRAVVSFDHYAYGCVDDWICRQIAGIDTDTPGYRHILINPYPDKHLQWCKRTLCCEAGEIRVAWRSDALEVDIPCNTTATVTWDGVSTEVGSGHYSFKKVAQKIQNSTQ